MSTVTEYNGVAVIVDERKSSDGSVITLYCQPAGSLMPEEILTVAIVPSDESGDPLWVLAPKDRAEAVEMFNHTFAYSGRGVYGVSTDDS